MAEKIVNDNVKKLSNDVDKLFLQITGIQQACKHTFLLEGNLEVSPSLIEGISLTQNFTIICAHCSLRKGTVSHEVCPRCLSKMAPSTDPGDEWWNNGRGCEAYYGGSEWDHSFYAPRICICGQCGWKVVWKEWDR